MFSFIRYVALFVIGYAMTNNDLAIDFLGLAALLYYILYMHGIIED